MRLEMVDYQLEGQEIKTLIVENLMCQYNNQCMG